MRTYRPTIKEALWKQWKASFQEKVPRIFTTPLRRRFRLKRESRVHSLSCGFFLVCLSAFLIVDEELSFKDAVREALEYEIPMERLVNFETFEGPPISIFFYSTFVTSFWLWLYALLGALARSEKAVGGLVR
jgi:hypothetical protein